MLDISNSIRDLHSIVDSISVIWTSSKQSPWRAEFNCVRSSVFICLYCCVGIQPVIQLCCVVAPVLYCCVSFNGSVFILLWISSFWLLVYQIFAKPTLGSKHFCITLHMGRSLARKHLDGEIYVLVKMCKWGQLHTYAHSRCVYVHSQVCVPTMYVYWIQLQYFEYVMILPKVVGTFEVILQTFCMYVHVHAWNYA